MKIICDTADLWGVSMELDVNPHEMPYRLQEAGYGKTRMTPEMIEKMDIMNENQLKKFYSRFGFEQDNDVIPLPLGVASRRVIDPSS